MNHTSDYLITAAVDMACEAHKGQWRNCGTPYLIHPLEVARRLARWGITKVAFPNLWAAAILHDVVEDSEFTLQDIETRFNREVAHLVEQLTFYKTEHETKALYMESFATKSVEAVTIKVADRLQNVEDFLAEKPAYAVKYCKKASALFDVMFNRQEEIIDFFGSSGSSVFAKMLADYASTSSRTQRGSST